MQIIKQVLYHDFSTLNVITHQEQYFCCVTLYYVVSDVVHEARPQASLFHIIQPVLILQSCVVKLLVLGSCKIPKPTYDELMEEPMDKTVTTSVAVSKCVVVLNFYRNSFSNLLSLCTQSNMGKSQHKFWFTEHIQKNATCDYKSIPQPGPDSGESSEGHKCSEITQTDTRHIMSCFTALHLKHSGSK